MKHKNPAVIDNLAFVSVKHEVALVDLYHALEIAKRKGKAKCAELSIEYRGNVKDEAIFLITKNDKVVMQFKVEEEFLYRKDLHFEKWLDTDRIQRQMAKQNLASPLCMLIQNLRHGMKKVSLEAEVLKTEKAQSVRTQFGSNITLTNILIGDKTGTVRLCLWGEQPNKAAKGDIIQIKNATVRTYNGEKQLNLGQKGTIAILLNKTDKLKILQ